MPPRTSKPKPTIFSERGTTRHFLFNPPAAVSSNGDAPCTGNGSMDAMRQAFPEIYCGEAFLRYAVEQMQKVSCFGSMIIRMDGVVNTGSSDDHDNTPFILGVSRLLDALCRMENGTWGPMEADSLGCFFPGRIKDSRSQWC